MIPEAVRFRTATGDDLPAALPVIREFYRHFEFPWDDLRKAAVLRELVADPRAGRLVLAWHDGRVIGYALVAFYLALEFDGHAALLDEFFVLPAGRGAGIGSRLLEFLAGALARDGLRIVRLEIDDRHPEAASLYARHGFVADGRRAWSRRLRGT